MVERPSQPYGNVPAPDPSLITSDHINRVKTELRDEFRAALAALNDLSNTERRVLSTRMDAMDKASDVLSDNITRVPTNVDRQVGHLTELHDEKFISIQKQFIERDVRTDQSAVATKIAVDAALSAQKEAAAAQNESNAAAITKSEASTIKQMDGMLALLASNNTALNDKISVINARLDRGEGGSAGARLAQEDNHLTMASVLGIVGGVVSVVSLMAMIAFGLAGASRGTIPGQVTVAPPATIQSH